MIICFNLFQNKFEMLLKVTDVVNVCACACIEEGRGRKKGLKNTFEERNETKISLTEA